MQQNLEMEEEKVWWVCYVYKKDLELCALTNPEQGNAFFYARNEEDLGKKIAGWMHYIKHESVVVQEIKQVTHDFRLEFFLGPLPQLPPEQAEAVLRAYGYQGAQVEEVSLPQAQTQTELASLVPNV